jgi:hypothetical protein
MPTLTQYWNDEVSRIETALAAAQSDLALLRSAVQSQELTQRANTDGVRQHADEVAAARRALGTIPMPADSQPLLDAFASAIAALRASQSAIALDGYELLFDRATLTRGEGMVQQLTADLAEAKTASTKATQAEAQRAALVAKFQAGGSLENLVVDAKAALTDHEATAKARVESEFPNNAAAEKSFIARVRDRAALLTEIEVSAAQVEAPAYLACKGAVASLQRDFDAAVAQLQDIANASAQVAADSATLARLAALPAPNPPTSYSILTRWQHDLLFDAAKEAQREATLATLTDVDDARRALIAKQEAYDKALNDASLTEPDVSLADLNATTLATEKGELDTALQDLQDAHDAYAALSADDRKALNEWFAAVPDTLWDALGALDAVLSRLHTLAAFASSAALASSLTTAITTAETAFEAALRAARITQRQKRGAELACSRAQGNYQAWRDMAGPLQSGIPHFSTLL